MSISRTRLITKPSSSGGGGFTTANNGLSSPSSTTVQLGHGTAGSGASDFLNNRYLYTGNFSLQIGGTAGNNIFKIDGTTGAVNIANNKFTVNYTTGRIGSAQVYGAATGNIIYGGGNDSMTGDFNTQFGMLSFSNNTIGANNTAIGYQSLKINVSGANNTAIGSNALITNTTGGRNTAVGSSAGFTNGGGTDNIFLGYQAGFYETNSNRLYITNQQGTNLADGVSKAIIYGVMSSTTASQTLNLNAATTIKYRLTLGENGTAGGILTLKGTTSGSIDISTQSTAGTWSLVLPTTAGSAGYALVTDGVGNTSWAPITTTTSLPLSSITAATAPTSIDNGSNTVTWNWNSITTGNGFVSSTTSVTTGFLASHTHSTSVIANGGSMFNISSTGVNTSTTTGSLLNLSSTASTSSTQFLQTYSGLTTGIGEQIVANALSSGSAMEIVSTSTAPTAGTNYANTYKGLGINLTGALSLATGKSYGIWVVNAKTGGTNNFDSAAARFEGASEFKATINDGKILRFYNNSNALIGEINHRNATSGLQFLSGGNTYMVTDSAGLVGLGSATAPVGTVNIQTSTTSTSGTSYNMYSTINFAPTSGTRTLVMNYIAPTINQTGGANGITRGLFIDPTLTAVGSSFRALEISNTSQFAIYQTGSGAHNYLNGTVGVGTTANAATAALQIDSTTKGFLLPRLTGAQAVTLAAASPAQGLLIFVTSTSGAFTAIGWWGYDGTNWVQL